MVLAFLIWHHVLWRLPHLDGRTPLFWQILMQELMEEHLLFWRRWLKPGNWYVLPRWMKPLLANELLLGATVIWGHASSEVNLVFDMTIGFFKVFRQKLVQAKIKLLPLCGALSQSARPVRSTWQVRQGSRSSSAFAWVTAKGRCSSKMSAHLCESLVCALACRQMSITPALQRSIRQQLRS